MSFFFPVANTTKSNTCYLYGVTSLGAICMPARFAPFQLWADFRCSNDLPERTYAAGNKNN